MSKKAGTGIIFAVISIFIQLILTFTFVALKLFGLITFSWWWIFSPIWLPGALGWSLLVLICLVILVNGIIRGAHLGYKMNVLEAVWFNRMREQKKDKPRYDA